MAVDLVQEEAFAGLTETNWWTTAPGIPMDVIKHEVRIHPAEKGKPGPLTYVPVAQASGGLFTRSDLHYYIRGEEELNPVWAVRGRHGHPAGAKLEYFVAVMGLVYVELHSANGCRIVQLQGLNRSLPIPSGVWHAAWIPPNALLEVVASGESAFDVAFSALPCDCDRRRFVRAAGLDPNLDPTLRR